MKRLSLIISFLLLTTISFCQQYPYAKWDSATLSKANSAKDAIYLNYTEKKVVFYLNLARLNGKLFSETYLQNFLDTCTDSKYSKSYVSSLIRDLEKSTKLGLEELQPDSILCIIAKSHAINMGKKGKEGHAGFNKRYAAFISRGFNNAGENCQYGQTHTLAIVIELLIDDKIRDLGHRKNILNKAFKFIGVGIAPHKKYKINTVQSFGG